MCKGTVSSVRVILTGGGTGGHIYPALSMIKAIKEKYPKATFLYIGTPDGLEATIVPKAGIAFTGIKVSGIKRSLSFENVKTAYHFLTGIKQAKKHIKVFKPDVVIGTGGYVCGPVVYAAAKLKIKTIIHEQNSLPGITNKFLARYVNKIMTCFDAANSYFPKEKTVLTGNPRATEVATTLKLGKTALGLNPHKKMVLISGGSRGARPINDSIKDMIHAYEKADYQVVFVTGSVHYETIVKEIGDIKKFKNVIVKPFIEDMPKYLVIADLFVGRAGATTLAEITALGVASLLIPSPYVAENHQEYNARSVTDVGGGKLILEKSLTAEGLFETISEMLASVETLTTMAKCAKNLGITDASARIMTVVEGLVN